jgi:hypothetical protein
LTQQAPPRPLLSPEDTRFAWQLGELGYRLRNIQKKARQAWLKASVSFLKFYLECTRRLGKSTYGLIWLTEDCIKNPGGVSAFFAPVKEGIRDYIGDFDKPDTPLGEAFKDCPLDLRPTLDASLSLNFPNGSKIIFRGSNNQQHRTKRGNAFRRVYVDEARDVDDLDNLVDSVIIPSLFSTVGRLMIGSTPADTEDHPLYAIKQAAEREGWYFHCSIYDAGRYDPGAFPPERIALWKKETRDPVAWAREYEARWVKDPNKNVIPEWDDSFAIHAAPRDEFFAFYQKYGGLDSGVTDKTAGILAYYDFKAAKLYVEDEFTLQDSEVRTDRIAELFKAKEKALGYQVLHDRKDPRYRALPPNEKVYRRVADNNNLILVNDLNALHDLDFFPTRKDELAAMINLVREWIKDGRIKVSQNCQELLGCLRNAIWDKKREKLAKSKVYGHFDALMALVYLVRNVDTQTNPIPAHFGKSWATHGGVPMNANVPQTAGDKLAAVFNIKTDREVARADFARGRTE